MRSSPSTDPVVLRVCRALLGPADADDAWSETFLSALRAYPDLRPGSNVRGWLVTIAHNRAIDAAPGRRAACRDRPNTSPRRPSADEHVEPDPALRGALDALAPKQRGAVVLRYLADLSYAEVAGRSTAARPRRDATRRTASRASARPTAPRGAVPHERDPHDDHLNTRRRPGLGPRGCVSDGRRSLEGPPRQAGDRGRRSGTARPRVPNDRQPLRLPVARRHSRGPGARRVRAGGSRRRARATGPLGEPESPRGTGEDRQCSPTARRVLRRHAPELRRGARSPPRGWVPPGRDRAPARHRLRDDGELRPGRSRWRATPPPPAPPAARARTTRSRSWCRATGSFAATARSVSTSAAPRSRRPCSRWRPRPEATQAVDGPTSIGCSSSGARNTTRKMEAMTGTDSITTLATASLVENRCRWLEW